LDNVDAVPFMQIATQEVEVAAYRELRLTPLIDVAASYALDGEAAGRRWVIRCGQLHKVATRGQRRGERRRARRWH
jgi:hypothetical protein